ncbi:MAG: hypothetical protein MUO42_10655, partial [Anaerolineaceae bacterium]|nr:hypothetical protein [Anaerolineaceae bacterium]
MTIKTDVSKKELSEKETKEKKNLKWILNRILYNRPILLVTVILLLALIMTLNYPTAFPQQANFAAILLDTAQGGIL